VIYVNVHKTKE